MEGNVSDLEGCYVANLYCLRLGKLGNTWNFGFGTMPCRNSVFFRVGCYLKQHRFRWFYRREGIRSRRLLCSKSLLFEVWNAWKCMDFQGWEVSGCYPA